MADTPSSATPPDADVDGRPGSGKKKKHKKKQNGAVTAATTVADGQGRAKGRGSRLGPGLVLVLVLGTALAAATWSQWGDRARLFLAGLLPDTVLMTDRTAPDAPPPPQTASGPAGEKTNQTNETGATETGGLAGLEGRLADIDRRLDRFESGTLAGLETRLGDFETALAEMDQRIGRAADAAASSRAAALEALGVRLAALENAVGDILATADRHGESLILALSQLRRSLDRGAAFSGELALVARLAADMGDTPLARSVATLRGALDDYAAAGLATLSQLADRFPALAAAIRREAAHEGNADSERNWWQGVRARLAGLVDVRRVDANARGDSVTAVLARAEAALLAGDFAAAAGTLGDLTGAAGERAAPWIAETRARLLADPLLERIDSLAIATLAGPASPPATPPQETGPAQAGPDQAP